MTVFASRDDDDAFAGQISPCHEEARRPDERQAGLKLCDDTRSKRASKPTFIASIKMTDSVINDTDSSRQAASGHKPLCLDAFVNNIFRGLPGDDECIVIGKANEVRRWRPGTDVDLASHYMCISTVRPAKNPRAQRLRRQIEDLVKTYVIVLDDVAPEGAPVGPKQIDPRLIKVQPSYKLETSPGNFQWGYVLGYGSDPAKAAALIEAISAAKLTDKGAGGAQRIVRVPGSINEKSTLAEPFVARLVEEHWERTWTLSQLELAMGVTTVEPRAALGKPTGLAEGERDPVFDWLVARGMVLSTGTNPRGFYDIHCPWEREHSGEVDRGTGYQPGSPGAFKCLHGHCLERKTKQLKEWIKEQDPQAELLPDMTAAVQKLADMLRKHHPREAEQAVKKAQARREAEDERQEVRAGILQNFIHVRSEGAFWSVQDKGLITHKTLNDHLYPVMKDAGLLDYRNASNKPAEMDPDKWFKKAPDKLSVARIVYRLGSPMIVDDCLNKALEAPDNFRDVVGDVSPWLEVVHYTCGSDPRIIELLLNWLAMVIGTYGLKPGWHILIRGAPGTGKNLSALPLSNYLNKSKLHERVEVSALGRQFNDFLSKRLVTVEELRTTTPGSMTGHDVYNALKPYTALGAHTVMVNEKNLRKYDVTDQSCWMLSSNEDVPMPIEPNDRRFMVIEGPEEKKPDAWYAERATWMTTIGEEAVLGWLQRRWDAMSAADRAVLRGTAPMTQAKLKLIENAEDAITNALRRAIRGDDGLAWPDLRRLPDIVADFRNDNGDLLSDRQRREVSQPKVTKALKAAGCVQLFNDNPIRGADGKSVRLWCLRSDKSKEYEALGHQEVYALHAKMKGDKGFGRMVDNMMPGSKASGDKVVNFQKKT